MWALSNSSFSLAKKNKLLWESYMASLAVRSSEGKHGKLTANLDNARSNHKNPVSIIEG
jgi:hypothetical protein